MKITPLDVNLTDLMIAGAQGNLRANGGVHVSTLVGELWEAVGGLPERDPNPDVEEDARMKAHHIELGSMFEDTLAETFVARMNRYLVKRREDPIERPGTITVHGIAGTCDFLRPRPRRVMEVKLTRKSSKYQWTDNKFWGWLTQMKAYCYQHDTNQAELYVYFINGDWRPPLPQFGGWLFTFSDGDLDDTYRMLLSHACETKRMSEKRYRQALRAMDRGDRTPE